MVHGLNGQGVKPEWVGEIAHDLPAGECVASSASPAIGRSAFNGVERFADGNGTGETPGGLCATVTPDSIGAVS